MLRDGKVIVVTGSTGSAKTVYVQQLLVGRTRQMIWDPEAQYDCDVRVYDQSTLARTVSAVRHKSARIAYTPSDLRDFDFWAQVTFCWVRFGAGQGRYSAVVAEETADVTNPGKAPPGYGMLVRRIRKYHGDLFAITQRPAESDKTAFGNANLFHCGVLVKRRDRETMAAEMDIDRAVLDGLRMSEEGRFYDYVQFNPRTKQFVQGRLTFDAPKPHGKPRFSKLLNP